MNDQLKPGSFTAQHIVDSAHAVGDLPGKHQAWPPLGLLRTEGRDIPALLLLSFADSHRHAFDYLGCTIERHSDPQVVVGEFLQRATGKHYTIGVMRQVAAPDAGEICAVPAAWLELFADLRDCLRQAEPYVTAVSSRDPELARLAARIRSFTQESPES